MSTDVTLTIDGAQVTVPKGTLIIRAAEQVGIMIPRFCDHPLLKPVAACRQCLVEVAAPAGPEGKLRPFPKPQPACAVEVTPGMVVGTQLTSDVAAKAQASVMELVLINHPLDCPVCDKGGECPLQNQAMSTGRASSRFVDVKNTFPKPLNLTPQILLDRERCVLCQRCTRFVQQIPADPFIALQKRGANQQIGRFDPAVLGVAPVDLADAVGDFAGDVAAVNGEPFAGYFAGNIVQICPVGALTSAAYHFRSRPFDLVSTESVAEHDANGSTIRVDYRRGQVLRRMAGNDPGVNQEWLSDKDRFGFRWQAAQDRFDAPLVRADGGLVETAWPNAVAKAAKLIQQSASFGVLPGGRLTLEDAFAYGVFTRQVLGSDNIDFRARPGSAEEAQFLAHHVAGSGLGVTFDQLTTAPAVLMAGFEPEDEGGILYLRLRAAQTKVFGVAPLASRGLRRLGGTWLPSAPGREAEVLDALVADAAGPVGQAANALAGGVIVVGERLASAPGAYTAALAAAERLGAKLVWIPRRAGERAAVEAGLLPGLWPYGQPPTGQGGLDLTGILEAAAAGEIDTLVVGGLELSDLPDPDLARRALTRANVIGLQVRRDELADVADVLLPVAPPAEKPGTFINWEGRPRPFPQVLTSKALSDARVLGAIAQRLGGPVTLGQLDQVHQLEAKVTQVAAPKALPGAPQELEAGQGLLSTWHALIDDAAGLAGEPHAAAGAPMPVATISPATANEVGVGPGDRLTVANDRGAITLPVRITEMVDHVVHLPTKSPGSWVAQTLAAASGTVVALAKAEEVKK